MTFTADLNDAQVRALVYLLERERHTGREGLWMDTSAGCSAPTAKVLAEVGLVKYESKVMQRGPRAGRLVKRVKLTAKGRKVATKEAP